MNPSQEAPPTQDPCLERCKALIEQSLGWGAAAEWQSQDFEELSLRIEEETGRTISATTLKRIWGRVSYDSTPSRHSLDTLAAFLSYASWRDFAATMQDETEEASLLPTEEVASPAARRRIPRTVLYLCCSVVLLGVAVVSWLGVNGSPEAKPEPVVPSEVVFRSRPVAQGLPNTVIFDYDVRGVVADSFFIQQSWDQRRRALVAPHSQTYTAIYYRPGFFNAKLIANDSVLQEHPVHVTTEGWLALVEDDPIPVYLEETTPSNGFLAVADAQLQQQGFAAGEPHPPVSFYNVRDFGGLHTDNFSFEALLRHDANDGRFPCKRAEVAVIGERGAITMAMGIPGCVSDIDVMFGEVYLGGDTNDLSAFGIDLATWQRVRCEVQDRSVRMQVGDNTPFTGQFTRDIGRVVGLRLSFEGNGAVDAVVLKDAKGTVVYEDDF